MPNHPVPGHWPSGLAAIALLGALAISACGDAAPGAKEIADACVEATNMSRAICDCMGQKAVSDLGPKERSFVVAALREDEETTTRLRGELSLEGAMKAGMFMTKASSCALESGGSPTE